MARPTQQKLSSKQRLKQ